MEQAESKEMSLAETEQGVPCAGGLKGVATINRRYGNEVIKNPLPLAVIYYCLFFSFVSTQAQMQVNSLGTITNNSIAVAISAPVGRTYMVETSTNFSAWNSLTTNIVAAGSVSFADTNVAQFQRRFYRGKLYWTVIVPNTYPTWLTTNGSGGRLLNYPSGWQIAKGADGRTIAFPSGWNTAQGSDGRMIAFPPGFTNKVGADGRMVAYYQTGFTNVQGSDGRIVAYPASGWTNRLGADGRRVAFPLTYFSTTNGIDGRVAAFPTVGWTNSRGADGRSVTYLSSDFATTNGADGRKIAYPNAGWALRQGADGRTTSYPTNTSATINLDFQDQSLFALLGTLKTILSPTDFNNYVIYAFFGTGEQQFAD
ncbi:MAG: hypothetical protein NTZ16_12345 [Verrucomicrobia bacterium]|nr:hypothetical protein [Verrucomicrobiota bacterium]